jgi:hypothetical protein
MFTLTVGQVSGVIAAIITILQLFFPTALALLVVGVLRDDMSAVSWSSIGATLHGSYWATILRADTSVAFNVQRSVKWLRRLATLTTLLIALASIITPLGLSDEIEPENSLQDVSFPYLADNGPFGYGTPPRDDLGFNRECGIPTFAACPGSNTIEVKPEGDFINSDFPYGYNSRIPQEKIDLFQSGLKEQMQTVSSFFDIQFRAVTKQQDPAVNNGTLFNVGTYRQVSQLVLDDAIEAVEGLVVNTADKGVAFRNHTIPSGIPLGATWTEDLLVMEPVTQCVNTNLTIDFTMSGLNGSFGGSAKSPVLTDRGGFALISKEFPFPDMSAPQVNPDLYGQAYLGAWAFNVMTAIYLNVTRPKPDRFAYLNSEVGKTFFMPESTIFHVNQLTLDSYAELFSHIEYDNTTFLSDNSTGQPAWPNPFQISSSNYSDITDACSGVSSNANSNLSSVAVGCGIVYGNPRLENGKTALFYDPGTKLSMPVYSCATAVKTSIKTFTFRFNGTEGLKSLHVDSIKDQTPSNTHWGVENNNDRSDLDIESAPPVWGLVSSDTKPTKNLDVVKSPHLYLPGKLGTFTPSLSSIGNDNMPGLNFHVEALYTIYNGGLGDTVLGVADYSGQMSIGMYAKWQQLMASTNGTAHIVDLIFTDLAANALVGTKSWLESSNFIPGGDQSSSSGNNKVKRQSTTPSTTSQTTAKVPVRLFTRRIQYNYLYGIPASIAVLLSCLIGTLTLLYFITGKTSISKTKHYLHATSPGRIMSLFLYPGECEPQTSTSRWVRGVGGKKVHIGAKNGWRVVASERVEHPEKLSNTAFGHGEAVYTGNANATNLPGYENDMDPLIASEAKPHSGMAIQMTPLGSPMPGAQGGFQQQQQHQNQMPPQQQQQYHYGQHHVVSQVQGQGQYQQGGYPVGGFAR